MRALLLRDRRQLLSLWFGARFLATSYSGRIVREASAGRSITVEIDPPDLLRDTRGYALPRRDLVCRIARILQPLSTPVSNPFLDLSDYLQSLTLIPTPAEVSEVLKALRSWKTALQFFHFCATLPGYRHDCFTYNRAFWIISKMPVADVGLVRRLMDGMEKEGVRGNISTVNILISMHDAAELGKCLYLAKKWSLRLNGYTYKCLLQAYLRSYDVEKAFEVYKVVCRRGYQLDIFAYNMLLDALAKADKVEDVNKVFADMKHKHCEPDVYTYTILIRMSGRTGKADEVLSYCQNMIAKCCNLNLIAYNTVIEAYATNRMVDKIFPVLQKMIDTGCRPNEFTYCHVLDGLSKERKMCRIEEVVKICNKFISKPIYAYLVKKLSNLGHVSQAHNLFVEMWMIHDKGDRNTCMAMLGILCNAGKTLEAMDLISKIHEKGLSADNLMYNLVFSALSKLNQTSHISTLYEQMKNHGPPADVFTFNILISSFGKAGQVDRVLQLFEEMEDMDCQPDVVTYNSLINSLGKNGELDEAHMRLKEMKEKGLTPDVFTYTILIECFGKSNNIEMACKLFHEMLSERCTPSIVTYNVLLDCLEKCGKTTQAFDIYVKLKQQGLSPDAVTYTIIERLQNKCLQAVRVQKEGSITGWVVSPL